MAEPTPKKPFPVVYVVVPAVILMLSAFLALWQFLTPTDHRVVVAYSDFIADVHAGKVAEISIRDREIRYRLSGTGPGGHAAIRETIGPIPDQALVESLKPTDPNAPLPKIAFEK
jgi:cell division protease FtsH